jgi:acetate kinase
MVVSSQMMSSSGSTATILTLNGGSSSLKFALFSSAPSLARILTGKVDRIGLDGGTFETTPAAGRRTLVARDHGAAVAAVLDHLAADGALESIVAAGHRVVHGGTRLTAPQVVDDEVIAELRRLSPLDPAHLPGEIAIIETLARVRPDLPQVACFDTAFHAGLPRVARLVAIPRRYEDAGVRRYGFHGLSYQFLLGELARVAGAPAAHGRVILAHLGNGASLAAVRDGRCVETTMGFTPTSGIPMGTRTGDLDPGVLLFLMRREGLTADGLDELVNHKSGLLGVSDVSPDMRDLLARRAANEHAADAVALFCHQAKKAIGALAAVLGGVDTLVFAGGIGESAAAVRAGICAGLEHLGIHLDAARNDASAGVISADASTVAVRVIRTDEEIVIAGSVREVLGLDRADGG